VCHPKEDHNLLGAKSRDLGSIKLLIVNKRVLLLDYLPVEFGSEFAAPIRPGNEVDCLA
jgi:hypothetical protein